MVSGVKGRLAVQGRQLPNGGKDEQVQGSPGAGEQAGGPCKTEHKGACPPGCSAGVLCVSAGPRAGPEPHPSAWGLWSGSPVSSEGRAVPAEGTH